MDKIKYLCVDEDIDKYYKDVVYRYNSGISSEDYNEDKDIMQNIM